MSKKLSIIFSVVILVSVVCAGIVFAWPPEGASNESSSWLTIVRTPEQTEVELSPAFPDPRANWVALPDGDNLAAGKSVVSGEFTEVYDPINVTDENLSSYWESATVPAELTIDLADTYTIQTVVVRLNPAPIWEGRTQGFEVLASQDGTNFTVVSPDARHHFDPDSGNIVRIDFDPTAAKYVRLVITENSASRSNGGQAAEVEVYE